MTEWQISDQEITETERLLLPHGACFMDDAKDVIRCWHSTDVEACPGSGKTTVLLAKLKLLADRMPLDKGAGICVLSHTNIAVDVIKHRLSEYEDKLFDYPNFIGTIQSFVDKFVTIPFIRQHSKVEIRFVDNEEYGRKLYDLIGNNWSKNNPYGLLRNLIYRLYKDGNYQYSNIVEYYQNITLKEDGIYHRNNKFAGLRSPSGKQFMKAKWDILVSEGILLYGDTYYYANAAINNLTDAYTNLFSRRFAYVFIDEYQDCNSEQRDALNKLFDSTKCCVIRVGDSDQSIYNSWDDTVQDWIPASDSLSITSSCRYSQEIANILVPLRKNRDIIISACGICGNKPIIIVFDKNNPSAVVDEYAKQIIKRNLNSPTGVYYAIGFRKKSTSGLTVGSYWDQYDNMSSSTNELKYWRAVEDICNELTKGQLYRAEQIIKRLICKIYRELHLINHDTGRPMTQSAIYDVLKTQYKELYSNYIMRLANLDTINLENVDVATREFVNVLFGKDNVFECLSTRFMDHTNSTIYLDTEKNIYEYNGVKIKFDTIHAVKGQTHDTTLYLETEHMKGSDLKRILQFYGKGKYNTSSLYDYSRKLAYVGLSRPKKLLCVAMQSDTYINSRGVFSDELWEIVDLR